MGFFMPTKVLYGKDVILKNRDVFQSTGESFLIVTGKSSKQNGSLDDLLDVLEGKHVYVYDETPENPPLEVVKEVAENCEDVDVVIGLGGGSPMDTAKAVAVLMENKHLKPEELYDKSKYKSAKTIICVPTTAGTGSEVTQYSVLTVNGRKRGFSHDCAFPKLSFVDYKYTITLNEALTLSTALDALSHAVEGFLSTKATPFSDTLAVESMKIIKEYLPRLMDDLDNEFYRERMMFASTLAGMVIAQTGTTVAHALGYPLTTEKGVKHGLATAVFLPFELKVAKKHGYEKANRVLEIFDDSLYEFFRSLNVGLNIKISDEEINSWTQVVVNASHLSATPGKYDLETIMQAYNEAREHFCC
ncbi:iron-containing alcohol dehydrogenase family protein [Fervidobacterium islandicum]|uniref:Iron-containing alcohol dehydrogenase family protein n=1 Tax=Fervidobacterium islandicum TaxID=2423 RepID=A0AAI8GDA0_FERIS|nr:iron-containing alcohol dehydrogenase family protein [Fervidobacterium islandicum]AMW32794.1 iron-containing alcohol dehydrogenase family protein [Fervidobacterium islandicum]